MANYEEARVKLTKIQLNKLKSAAKKKTGATLRISKKNFQDEELSNELFLTTREKTKTRNAFANKMLTDVKLSKAELSKMIQLGGNLGKRLGNMVSSLCKKALINLVAPMAKHVLHKLVTKANSSILDKVEKNKLARSCKNRKKIHLFISIKDMDDIIKIIESLENSDLLIPDATETVKHELKNKKA